jgi:acyl carrier protein
MQKDEIKKQIRSYISEHVFSGKMPADFTDDTKMISTRLVNSIIVMHMINHFEESLKIELEAHEVSVDNLDTVNLIADFFNGKVNAGK